MVAWKFFGQTRRPDCQTDRFAGLKERLMREQVELKTIETTARVDNRGD